jgi:type IV pilus assembly PilN-like protein
MPRGSWLESLSTTPATTTTDTTSTGTSSTTTTPSSTSEGSAVVTSNGLSGLAGSGSAAPVAATFTVTGYARSQATVANVMERLSLIPALTDVSLTSSQRTPLGDKNAVQFTIGANVRSLGGNG